MTPCCHTKAATRPSAVFDHPTTWPRLLMSDAPLLGPPSVPRSTAVPCRHSGPDEALPTGVAGEASCRHRSNDLANGRSRECLYG
jgi:hypothetical protein